jgi:hypothetical protein
MPRDEAKWKFGESPSLSRNLIRAKIESCRLTYRSSDLLSRHKNPGPESVDLFEVYCNS